MISTRETPDSSTRALWQSFQHGNIIVQQEGLAKEMMNFSFPLSYFEGFFNMP
jgi:hypothetical protein